MILIWDFGGGRRFLTGVWHPDLYLYVLRNLAWIYPEVFILLRSVKAKIYFRRVSVKLREVVPGWPGGWVGGRV